MSPLPFFSEKFTNHLHFSVKQNIDFYLNDNLTEVLNTTEWLNKVLEKDNIEVDLSVFETLSGPGLNETAPVNDAKNSLIIWNCLENLTPKMAADERIWTALTHKYASRYVLDRWGPKSGKKLEPKEAYGLINDRFFCRHGSLICNRRGTQTRNALGRLWWFASNCNKATYLDFPERIKILIGLNTDFTQQFFERPTTSSIPSVIDAVLFLMDEDIKKDPNDRRAKTKPQYSDWFTKIDKLGGRKLLSALSKDELVPVFDEILNV